MSKKKKRRKRFHRYTEPGSPAGVVRPLPSASQSRVEVVAYGEGQFEKVNHADLKTIQTIQAQQFGVVWVHVTGLADAELICNLGRLFSLHRLAMEDVVNVHQQVKVDDYSDNLFVVTRMLTAIDGVATQQLSMFIGENFVVSFEEESSELVQLIARRIEDGHSQMQKHGPDFLAYALLDATIDQYFPLLEHFGERLDDLEDEITYDPPRRLVHQIHDIRVELRGVRRFVWQQREALNSLIRSTSQLVDDSTRLFLKDCHDHTIQLVELLEVFHETCSDLRDVYLSSISNRMNEIMMVLTIIATIFMPLSFIAGLYGMNFNTQQSPINMPELNWYFGYPFALGLMAAVAGGLLYYFYRRGWIGRSK